MGEATRNLPLSYRPEEYDDWGVIRFAPDDEGRARYVLKVQLPTYDEAVLDQHRRNGTDPCEEFGRKVVTAVNAHDDLVAALERLHRNFRLMLSARPVRDVAETEAEVLAALAKAQGQ